MASKVEDIYLDVSNLRGARSFVQESKSFGGDVGTLGRLEGGGVSASMVASVGGRGVYRLRRLCRLLDSLKIGD